MGTRLDARYHAHGQNHLADAGKPRALKGACVVWRGAFGQSTISQWQLTRCLPYPNAILRAFVEQVSESIQTGKQQMQVWSHLVIGQVIKTQKKHRLVSVKHTHFAWR
jgi:hypothetical protein